MITINNGIDDFPLSEGKQNTPMKGCKKRGGHMADSFERRQKIAERERDGLTPRSEASYPCPSLSHESG